MKRKFSEDVLFLSDSSVGDAGLGYGLDDDGPSKVKRKPTTCVSLPFLLTSLSILGGISFGYDTIVVAPALPYLIHQFGGSSVQTSFVVSAPAIGGVIGTLFFSLFTTHFGRKQLLVITSLVALLGAGGSSLSSFFWLVIVFRIILGIGLGGISFLCPLYVSEEADPETKGRFGSLFQLGIALGVFMGFVLGYVVSFSPQYHWQTLFGIGLIPPTLLLLFVLLKLPESETWLLQWNPEAAPLSCISIVRTTDENVQIKPWSHLFAGRKNRNKSFLGFILAVATQLTGLSAVLYFSPSIFLQSRLVTDLTNIGLSGCFSIATLVAVLLLDRIGARPLYFISLFIITAANLAVGSHFTFFFFFFFFGLYLFVVSYIIFSLSVLLFECISIINYSLFCVVKINIRTCL